MTMLPEFIELPEYNPKIYTIVCAPIEGKFMLAEYTHILFSYPSDAADYAERYLGGEVQFDGAELASAGECIGGMFFEKIREDSERNSHRALFCFNPNSKVNSITNDYEYFLELNKKYEVDPENWVLAYQWVQYHPAFYHRSVQMPEWWVCDDGWDSSHVYVGFNDDGVPVVDLEHGEWQDKDGVSKAEPTHDYRLDVFAPTFEEAYVAFAKGVKEMYDLRGIERTV